MLGIPRKQNQPQYAQPSPMHQPSQYSTGHQPTQHFQSFQQNQGQ